MRLALLVALVVLVDPAPAEACSHPSGGGSLGLPQMILPEADATGVPIDAQLVVRWLDCCFEDPPITQRITIRAIDGDVDVPITATVSPAWGMQYNLTAQSVRIVPDAPLAPNTTYQLFATMPSNWNGPIWLIGQFTTGDGPITAAPPAVPSMTVTSEAPTSCQNYPELTCCWDAEISRVSLGGTPGRVYDVTTLDGRVLAADAPAPLYGVVACGTVPPASGIGDPPYVPWIVASTELPLGISVVARDVAGRASPAVELAIPSACPATLDAGPPTDWVDPPGEDDHAGCRVAPAGRARPFGDAALGLALIAGSAAAWAAARRAGSRPRPARSRARRPRAPRGA